MLPSFMTPEAIRSNEEWSRRQNAKAQRMIRDEGFMTIDEMLEAAEENCRKSLQCKQCGTGFKSYYTLERHRGSENCKRRQAAQKGEDFIPKCQTTRHCEVCDKTIKFYNWTRHLESKRHKEELRKLHEPAFYCELCDKKFGGKRPKVMLKKHTSKKHMQRAQKPKMGYVHNACCLTHGFKKMFLEGPSEKRQMVKVV